MSNEQHHAHCRWGHRKQQEGEGRVLCTLALQSEPKDQFRTNWEDRGKPEEDPGGKVDHQLGNKKRRQEFDS